LSIERRKADHIRINLEENVGFPQLTTGLEQYSFVHQALPELDLDEIDAGQQLFGKRVSAPILVSSMTGGTDEAQAINRTLAEAAQACGLAMGLGSQRAGIEQAETAATFRVRDSAPDILLFANLGAVQLNYGYTVDQCRRAVEMAEADALILHLNPLQEVLQEGGDTHWSGLVERIADVCHALPVPVIAKEVGWGISEQAARMLIDAGIDAIDVAGAGGTSWSQVEMYRAPTERLRRLAAAFADWGIPTTQSLQAVCRVRSELGRPDLPVFASGGIRSGQDVAKCVALGADLVGLASPFLKRAVQSVDAVIEEMELLSAELRITMLCSGAGDLAALRRPGVLISLQGDTHV
jgi:isopentenyl-diphosphate Delta-isomerase